MVISYQITQRLQFNEIKQQNNNQQDMNLHTLNLSTMVNFITLGETEKSKQQKRLSKLSQNNQYQHLANY